MIPGEGKKECIKILHLKPAEEEETVWSEKLLYKKAHYPFSLAPYATAATKTHKNPISRLKYQKKRPHCQAPIVNQANKKDPVDKNEPIKKSKDIKKHHILPPSLLIHLNKNRTHIMPQSFVPPAVVIPAPLPRI